LRRWSGGQRPKEKGHQEGQPAPNRPNDSGKTDAKRDRASIHSEEKQEKLIRKKKLKKKLCIVKKPHLSSAQSRQLVGVTD